VKKESKEDPCYSKKCFVSMVEEGVIFCKTMVEGKCPEEKKEK
jgi:hypothetical protein